MNRLLLKIEYIFNESERNRPCSNSCKYCPIAIKLIDVIGTTTGISMERSVPKINWIAFTVDLQRRSKEFR